MDACGKPVASAVARLDEAWAPGIVAQRPAKLLDAGSERRVADHRVAPHGLEQLPSGYQLPGARDEHREDGSGPGREADLAPAGPQPPRSRIKAMVIEMNLVSHGRFRRTRPSRGSQKNLTVLLGLEASGPSTLPHVRGSRGGCRTERKAR